MNAWLKIPFPIRLGMLIAALVMAGCMAVSSAYAGEPSDNGVWASDQASLQGFVAVYAPVIPPAVVFYWFAYDEQGNQVWFISENVPVHSGRSEDRADIFKPMGEFVSGAAAIGDPVGELAISRRGSGLMIRFGIAPIDGFSNGCASELVPPVLPSPTPPPLPADKYPCQGTFVLSRVSPVIPELQ